MLPLPPPFLCPSCLQGFSHFFPLTPLCLCSVFAFPYVITEMHYRGWWAQLCPAVGTSLSHLKLAQQTLNTSHRGHPCSLPPTPCHIHTINIAEGVDCPLQAKERYSILPALCSLALALEGKTCLPVETAPLDTAAETLQSLCLHHNKCQLSNIIVLNKLFLSGTITSVTWKLLKSTQYLIFLLICCLTDLPHCVFYTETKLHQHNC